MVRQASDVRKRLRRFLTADPGRFAGGSAVSDPFGLLAIERERLAVLRSPQHDGSPRTAATANQGTGSTSEPAPPGASLHGGDPYPGLLTAGPCSRTWLESALPVVCGSARAACRRPGEPGRGLYGFDGPRGAGP